MEAGVPGRPREKELGWAVAFNHLSRHILHRLSTLPVFSFNPLLVLAHLVREPLSRRHEFP